MKIVWVMLNPGYVRAQESTIRLLASRGHTVRLLFNDPLKQAEDGLAERLAVEVPRVSWGLAPPRRDVWSGLAWVARGSGDYLRYLHPRFREAGALRARALIWPLGPLLGPLSRPVFARLGVVRVLEPAVRALEAVIPSSRVVERVVRSERPDVLLVTPLVDLASAQTDYLKSARALRIRTALCVASWDNLTNKGLIRVRPDLVLVWNETQKAEAVELHGVQPSRVVVTGAQGFDAWFGRRPSTTPGEFRRRVGLPLPAERPTILYACSSPFIAPDEAPFARAWAARIRAHPDPVLRTAGILIRPHPQNGARWRGVNFSDLDGVAIWPPVGPGVAPESGARAASPFPVEDESRADYFDSLAHCAAVVGINTSALIEAGILGRPVHTLLAPEFAATQLGTLHFRHLLEVGGGLLRAARGWDEHLTLLAESLARGPDDPKARRFVRAFVRPHGLDVPATPLVVDAIERLARMGQATPEPTPTWARVTRLLLTPAAWVGTRLRQRARTHAPTR